MTTAVSAVFLKLCYHLSTLFPQLETYGNVSIQDLSWVIVSSYLTQHQTSKP